MKLIPKRKPDFYLPFTQDCWAKGWLVKQNGGYDIVAKVNLNDAQEAIYGEYVYKEKFDKKLFETRIPEIIYNLKESIVRSQVKKMRKPKDLGIQKLCLKK